MRHAGHEPAPGGSRTSRGSRSPWGPADGPGRMASRQGPRRARQPHAGAPARPSARVEPRREHLAVLARQLVVEPRVRLLPRHRRSLLRRLEPPHRPALDHHVHRPPRLGQCIQCMMDVLYPRCAGLDVHKDTVVAAVRIAADGPANTEVRTFDTTTPGLLALSGWLAECSCTHVAMEATGVYWKPVWHILADGDLTLSWPTRHT